MPSLVTPTEREAFGREVFGASRERMLREIGEALDALTADKPLVLALEDLHWSDYSTLDLISYLARRRSGTRLMLVGTYRPAELIASGHPLRAVKQELLAKQQCEELPLEYLTEAAVAEHLDVRFPGHRFPAALAALIHERTEGNPLFMVNTIDYLVSERLLEQRDGEWRVTAALAAIKLGVPDSIRHLIEKQIDRLDPADQRLLEVASVAGAEFPAPAVSAALDDPTAEVEVRCEELSRRHHFVRNCGVQRLPTGAVVERYGFVHAVYRNVLYDRVSASRQMLLHRRLGEWGEAVYGERAGEVAAELAMHYERATDHDRAVRYLQQAARNAMQRSAYREAVALSRRGLQLIVSLPDSEARARNELSLQLTLGVPLIATEGYAAPAVGIAYMRARALCERLGDPPEIPQVLWGLWTFHVLSADLATAHDIAQEMLQLAERRPDPGMVMRSHWAMEVTCTHRGEFEQAVAHFEQALAAYEPDRHRDDAFLYALNPGVAMRCFAAWSMWFVGQTDRAVVVVQEGVALARELWEPHGLAHALVFAAILHQLRGERSIAFGYADEAITVASDHGLVLYLAMALVIRGWALIESGDRDAAIDHIRRGLAAWQTTGAELMRPHFLALLVEALDAEAGHDEALRVLADAMAMTESTGERCYQAELYRLKGERLLERATDQEEVEAAERCLEEALAIARRQRAQSLEARAAASLARSRSVRL
jgi:predicted ATPase